jgi:hypothetical protein
MDRPGRNGASSLLPSEPSDSRGKAGPMQPKASAMADSKASRSATAAGRAANRDGGSSSGVGLMRPPPLGAPRGRHGRPLHTHHTEQQRRRQQQQQQQQQQGFCEAQLQQADSACWPPNAAVLLPGEDPLAQWSSAKQLAQGTLAAPAPLQTGWSAGGSSTRAPRPPPKQHQYQPVLPQAKLAPVSLPGIPGAARSSISRAPTVGLVPGAREAAGGGSGMRAPAGLLPLPRQLLVTTQPAPSRRERPGHGVVASGHVVDTRSPQEAGCWCGGPDSASNSSCNSSSARSRPSASSEAAVAPVLSGPLPSPCDPDEPAGTNTKKECEPAQQQRLQRHQPQAAVLPGAPAFGSLADKLAAYVACYMAWRRQPHPALFDLPAAEQWLCMEEEEEVQAATARGLGPGGGGGGGGLCGWGVYAPHHPLHPPRPRGSGESSKPLGANNQRHNPSRVPAVQVVECVAALTAAVFSDYMQQARGAAPPAPGVAAFGSAAPTWRGACGGAAARQADRGTAAGGVARAMPAWLAARGRALLPAAELLRVAAAAAAVARGREAAARAAPPLLVVPSLGDGAQWRGPPSDGMGMVGGCEGRGGGVTVCEGRRPGGGRQPGAAGSGGADQRSGDDAHAREPGEAAGPSPRANVSSGSLLSGDGSSRGSSWW